MKKLLTGAVLAAGLATGAFAEVKYDLGIKGGSINGINDVAITSNFVAPLGITAFDFLEGEMSFSKEKQAKGSLNYLYDLTQNSSDSKMYLKVGAGAEMFKYDVKGEAKVCTDDNPLVACTPNSGESVRKSKGQGFGSIALVNIWTNDLKTEIKAEIGSDKSEGAFIVDYIVNKDTTLTASVGKSFSNNDEIDFDRINATVGFKYSF